MSQSKLSETGVPYLHCVKIEGNETEIHYNVTGSFFPKNTFQEAFKRHIFSSSQHHDKKFVMDVIVYLVSDYGKSATNSEERPRAMKVLKEFVGNSKTFSKVFNTNVLTF